MLDPEDPIPLNYARPSPRPKAEIDPHFIAAVVVIAALAVFIALCAWISFLNFRG